MGRPSLVGMSVSALRTNNLIGLRRMLAFLSTVVAGVHRERNKLAIAGAMT